MFILDVSILLCKTSTNIFARSSWTVVYVLEKSE